MFCLTIAGQLMKKIFHMFRNVSHIDHYIPAGQFVIVRGDKRRRSLPLIFAAIRKNHNRHELSPTGKSLEMARCGFCEVENGVV